MLPAARIFLITLLPFSLFAEDRTLVVLRTALQPFRAAPLAHLETRGATAEFTAIKHRLRDWIESRLTQFQWTDDAGVFAARLNTEIRQAGLTCDWSPKPGEAHCPDGGALGFVGMVKLDYRSGFLTVQTSLGIQCGYDDSAYVYESKGAGWARRWQSEQDRYTGKEYLPQLMEGVYVSPPHFAYSNALHKFVDAGDHLILTLGRMPWCSSAWQPVYYRLWQITAGSPAPRLLLDKSEHAFLDREPPIVGSVGPADALIEFTVGSIDVGVHNREAIRHYVIEDGTARQIDPAVLSPRDFVDEWLRGPWEESSQLTGLPGIERWRAAHEQLGELAWEFGEPTHHCPDTPDLWQVALATPPSGEPNDNPRRAWFLVRWRPPYHFTMIRVSAAPSPACTEPDQEADEHRVLFPGWQ